MTIKDARKKMEQLFSIAEIAVGGTRPWDIQVHEDEFYPRVLCQASLGLGESYMDGWWDCDRLDEFFYRVLKAGVDRHVRSIFEVKDYLKAIFCNLQNHSRSFTVGKRHYDIGNDLYERMLDKRMIYSCGYWKNAETLDEAQEAKLDLIFKKLGLKPGMKVLDIGCGWGGAAVYAAEKYGVEVLGITVSEEQVKYAEEYLRDIPEVEIKLQDYRDLEGKFDRIFSIGMFEHVGYKNYRTYMRIVKECLHDDGLFLLHTIGGNFSIKRLDPWIERYIFPNSMLPSARQITSAAERFFVMEDWHNFGINYDKTLMAWHGNFVKNWDILKKKYDQRFYRMWTYYLLCCTASFRARMNQLWQIVFSSNGVPEGYNAIR